MSVKSAIYTTNSSTQTVAINGTISPGTVIRRFGPNLTLSGNAIQADGPGYYEILSSITLAPTAAGEVTVTVYRNGIPIPGAIATETATAADDVVNLSIVSMFREFCPCAEGISNLTFVLSGSPATITNISTTTKRI